MSVEAAARRALKQLRRAGTAERRKVAKGYFPTNMTVLGTPNPDARAVASELKREVKSWPVADVMALVDCLVLGTGDAAPTMEGRFAGYILLSRHRDGFASLNGKRIEALAKGNDNWASVDAFACMIAGPAWMRGQLGDARVSRWSRSKDRWWRRTALVCTVPLNQRSKGGTGDTPRTLALCEALAVDHDDMIVKAVSWALRSLLEHDRAAVERFLSEHEDTLHKRVLREVRNKLRTGRKTPKR
jgi:3-methyladenine DNA glycosylase AlkD